MKIATIKGIRITLHFSTLAIVALVGYDAASLLFDATMGGATITDMLIVGLSCGLIILVSILVHELMHSLVALHYGLKISEIELYLFGGVSKIEEEPRSPKSEVLISFVGPLTSLLLGAAFYLIWYYVFIPSIVVDIILWYNGIINISLGLFNLLPAFPMDGGRVLRAIIWARNKDHVKSTRTASRVGSAIATMMIIFGFIDIFVVGLFGGIWYILIGFFLRNAASSSYTQEIYNVTLAKVTAKEMISLPEVIVPADMPIDRIGSEYFFKYRRSFFPVGAKGDLMGIIYYPAVKRAIQTGHAHINAKEIVIPKDAFPSVQSTDTGSVVLQRLTNTRKRPAIVSVTNAGGEVIGFITEGDAAFFLERE